MTEVLRSSPAFRAAWLCLVWCCTAPADAIDPTVHRTIAVGDVPGAAPLDRIDRRRSGRSRWALPDRPRLAWQTRVPAPIVSHAVTDDHGNIVVVSQSGELVELDKHGKRRWSVRAAPSGAASGPFLTAARERGFITRSGELLRFTPQGRLKSSVRLDTAVEAAPAATPTAPRAKAVSSSSQVLVRSDGAVVVGAGSQLLQIGAGEVEHRAQLAGRVGALLELDGATLITTSQGTVFEWSPPARPRELGSFGGAVDDGAALLDGARLIAVVDDARVVVFDLIRRRRQLSFSDPNLAPLGPPAIPKPGALRFMTREAVLISQASPGAEALRLPLDLQSKIVELTRAAPLVVDAAGRTAVARAGQPLLVVHPDGRVEAAGGSECAEPLAPVPVGDKRLLQVCREGTLSLLEQSAQ